jgi:hypothetical protein
MEMRVVYQNFDHLEMSFQCAVPSSICRTLEMAKQDAQASREASYTEIGPNSLKVMVYETGARGGYQYMFHTGPDGEIWTVSNKEDRAGWNVRVRPRSLCLALNGYAGTKEKILGILLNDLQAKGPDENDKKPLERISRVDYCLDFLIEDDFQPDIKNFVCASRAKKGYITEIPAQVESVGQFVEYVRVGKMPNRQITIYNKLREISASRKHYWWDFWGLKKSEITGKIWRVEIRAGKSELNKWNLRRFSDFEKMIGDVITTTLNDFEYRIPNPGDKNMTRWKISPLWEKAIEKTETNLLEYISRAERKEILQGIRKDIQERYEKLLSGILVGYTALTGYDISEIPGVLELVSGHILDEASENPEKFRKKYKKKRGRFSQLE